MFGFSLPLLELAFLKREESATILKKFLTKQEFYRNIL